MNLSIDLDIASAIPASEQLLRQIRSHILSGSLPAEFKLPSVRQLAADLDLAAGTVAKVYAALEAEGMVTTSRSKGTRIAPGKAVPNEVTRAAMQYIRQVKRSGSSMEEASGVVENLWNEVE